MCGIASAAWELGGDENFAPSRESLDVLMVHTAHLRPRPTRTELGLALAATGSVPAAVAHLIASQTRNQEGSHVAS